MAIASRGIRAKVMVFLVFMAVFQVRKVEQGLCDIRYTNRQTKAMFCPFPFFLLCLTMEKACFSWRVDL
jgi:hypothetical protein